MFVSTLFVTLLQLSLFAPSSSVQVNTQVQIDRHIQNLVERRASDVNYWFISQLWATHPHLSGEIRQRMRQIRAQNQLPATSACYINVFINSTDELPLYELLERGFYCERSPDLQVAALYEAPAAVRSSILIRMGKLPSEGDNASEALINKALGRPYDLSDLFKVRPFQLRDFYLLSELTSAGSSYQPLITYWDTELLAKNRISDPLEFLLLQTLVAVRHTIEYDYAKNYTYLRLVAGNALYTNLLSKQSTLKRLAFAAYIQGYYQTTLNFYREDLIPLTRTIRDAEEILRVELDFGNILFRLGDMTSALDTYRRVYDHIDLIRDERYLSALLNNLAVSFLNTGYFEQYVSLQLQAYEQASAIQAHPSQLRILNNLYIYHLRNGDWTNALLYILEQLDCAILSHRLQKFFSIQALQFGRNECV